MLDDHLKANLANWEERVGVHLGSDFYDVAGFKAGASSLTSIEESELGPFVGEGTSLLHLQCHLGLDTLSLARRGATVTGADFSPAAVAAARSLADAVGLSQRASFVCSDVNSLPANLEGRFDVVFTSWGVLLWLADLQAWSAVVAHFLRPGGTFYMAEFHPFALTLADDATADSLRVGYPYFQHGLPLRCDEPGTYADPAAQIQHTVTYQWTHGFQEIIDPLLERGLRLDFLHEFPYTHGLSFAVLEECDDGWLRVRGHHEDFPLSFSMKMTQEG